MRSEMARCGATRARGSGQALVEFLACSLALVPLFAGIVVVGRLQDLRSHTQMSARYGAFAVASGAPAADVQSEVRARFFGAPGAAVRADDARQGDRTDTVANPHWRDPMGGTPPFVRQASDVSLTAENRAPTGSAAGVLQNIASVADRAASWTGGRFDVDRRGAHAVAVRVRLGELPSIVASQPLMLDARASVFGGDWSADGPAQTAARTTALAPATLIRRIRPMLAPVEWALAALEPAFGDLCLGRIDVELVPADRLGPPGSGETGTWIAPCP